VLALLEASRVSQLDFYPKSLTLGLGGRARAI